MNYSNEDLANYRTEKAEEAFSDALFLVEKESWNAAANRLYYACFYITSAYLASQGSKVSTHSGIKSAFNQYFIKEGKLDKELGSVFNSLFNIRQEADYEDFEDIEKNDIITLLDQVSILISNVKILIEEESNES